MAIKTLKNIVFAGVASLTMLANMGCENPLSPSGPRPNNGQGVDSFTIDFNQGHMYSGETSSEVTGEVRKGMLYDVWVRGSNDGDSDRISVYADDVKVGTYSTEAIREGGNGWYVNQYSPRFNFIPSNDAVRLKVHIDSADSYGTWPYEFNLECVAGSEK